MRCLPFFILFFLCIPSLGYSRASRTLIQNTLIKNRFYDTALESFPDPVNLRQPIRSAVREFFQKTKKAAETQPDFAARYPELNSFLNWSTLAESTTTLSEIRVPTALGKVQLLMGNVESWWARYLIIQQAQKSIDVQYFIIDNDVFGLSFLALLLEKAKQGVKVRLMLDRAGCPIIRKNRQKALLQELALAGVEIHVFNPFIVDFPNLNFITRNHDKILLIDDRYFMTGGRNISRYYLIDPADDSFLFSDADVLIDSPQAAASAILAFQQEFDVSQTYVIQRAENSSPESVQKLESALQAMRERFENSELSNEFKGWFPMLHHWKRL